MRGNMRAERVRRNLTQNDVADRLKVHKNVVSRWENGDSEPTASNLIALCSLYECTPEYLLDMTDERQGAAIAD